MYYCSVRKIVCCGTLLRGVDCQARSLSCIGRYHNVEVLSGGHGIGEPSDNLFVLGPRVGLDPRVLDVTTGLLRPCASSKSSRRDVLS